MNIITKLFGKKKIDLVVSTTKKIEEPLLTPITVISGAYPNTSFMSATLIFDKSYLKEFVDAFSCSGIRYISSTIDDQYKIYLCADLDSYINMIKNLSTTNLFFKLLLEPLYKFDKHLMEDLCKDGLLDDYLNTGDRTDDDLLYSLQYNINELKTQMFLSEICSVFPVKLFPYVTVQEFLRGTLENDLYLEEDSLFTSIMDIVGEFNIRAILTPKYSYILNMKKEEIEEIISEDIGDPEETVITEDEDGNLIYDKENFM